MTSLRPLPITWPDVPELDDAIREDWQNIVTDYETEPGNLYLAWLYLGHHPAFWGGFDNKGEYRPVTGAAWYQSIELGVELEGEATSIWVEIFPSLWFDDLPWEEFHAAAPGVPDWRLNIKGATYEEAVILAASIVHNQYGNDREFLKIPELEEDKWYG